jgi:plastocyanin
MAGQAPFRHPLDSSMTRRALLRGMGGLLATGWLPATNTRTSVTDGFPAAPPAPAAPGTRNPATSPLIDLSHDRHVPPELSVPAGATVTWVNRASDWIGVAALDGSFESGRIAPGKAFAHRFARPGCFTYVCENHPIRNMTGRIEVR